MQIRDRQMDSFLDHGLNRRALIGASLGIAAAGPARGLGAMLPATLPAPAQWERLAREVPGRLLPVRSPLVEARSRPGDPATAELFRNLTNPYFIGDDPALTQTLGWTDGWTSQPSARVLAATSAADVAAAVGFARRTGVRIVVKGGGHSYIGGSNAPDSLLVWTRRMEAIELHDAFVAEGAPAGTAPQPAVSLGAGVMWGRAYDAVTTRGGRYVQGGGCMTVGVAGLVQGGGFGSFSKRYGTGAAGLIEAEVVTADGRIRIANAHRDVDLFWALKGGGGGSFGVVTQMTLRTHDLPATFGAVMFDVTATSDAAWRDLVARVVELYRSSLFNPEWGEQIGFRERRLSVRMLFSGLSQAQAEATWQPLLAHLGARPGDYTVSQPMIAAFPAQRMWDPDFLRTLPGVIRHDDRPGARPRDAFWAQNGDEAGWVIHGYHSTWLPASLLAPSNSGRLVAALIEAAAHWGVTLHFNKGIAGATPEVRAACADTSTNPRLLDAFALAIVAGGEAPAWPGVAGHEPDMAGGRRDAAAMKAAFAPLEAISGPPASYVSETDYFHPRWSEAFWGANYPRLLAIKRRYDPGNMFRVHHGVGS